MEHLHANCNNDLISSVYDHFYKESLNFFIKLCEEGIKLNNAVSHNKYAIYLIFNECKDKSQAKSPEQIRMKFDEARFHLEKSIQQGYNKSYFLLARILHEFFHEDDSAYKISHEGSINGEKYSKCLLGYFMTKGIGTTKNHQKGVLLMLESGANDLYEKFSTDIGIYYANLIKENENCPEKVSLYKEKAFEYFEKAYKMNKTKATINNYGICYMKGIGVPIDFEKAKEIFLLGASKKDSNSKYHLSYICKQLKKDAGD